MAVTVLSNGVVIYTEHEVLSTQAKNLPKAKSYFGPRISEIALNT